MSIFGWTILMLGSYLLGSIPTAYIVARANGIDIRKTGSGNVGATNVLRALGKWWGLLTFVLDAAKGFAPAYACPILAVTVFHSTSEPSYIGLLCSAAAVAGHNWPVFLGFKGGKGVATSAGALFGLAPLAGAIGLSIWILVFLLTRYVSLASIIATLFTCISTWFLHLQGGCVLPSVFSVLGLILIWRHRGNISRLLKGTENRMQLRKQR